MKTKPIVWIGAEGAYSFIAYCGNVRVGNVYHHYKPYERWQGIMSITKDKAFYASESEARAWLEEQFHSFLKEIETA